MREQRTSSFQGESSRADKGSERDAGHAEAGDAIGQRIRRDVWRMSEISDFLARKGQEWLKEEWERSKEKARDEEWPPRYHHWCGTPDIMKKIFERTTSKKGF